MAQSINIFWFRRDLRLQDNAGLFHALATSLPVLPIFIFDRSILDELDDKTDRRVSFIYEAVETIQNSLREENRSLLVEYGFPEEIFKKLLQVYTIDTVFANHDYEPYAIERDGVIKNLLAENNVNFCTYKDQVIFEKDEVAKEDGSHYTVYTPYSRKWLANFHPKTINEFPSQKHLAKLVNDLSFQIPSLESMDFERSDVSTHPGVDEAIIREYKNTRNFPALKGTSRLGVHLRFGTISIRELVKQVVPLDDVFLKELIWREFFMHLLWHRPLLINNCYRPEYEKIQWNNNEEDFDIWCQGKTGYPIVDAGMRELKATGFMHNRVRMITASFLCKHLLIDWRWGEAYFAKNLLDYELASNIGNWQWVAGCGVDAAPYFRIFNPSIQAQKFDGSDVYIKNWVPEYKDEKYPKPMVQHEWARERCLKVYKQALTENNP